MPRSPRRATRHGGGAGRALRVPVRCVGVWFRRAVAPSSVRAVRFDRLRALDVNQRWNATSQETSLPCKAVTERIYLKKSTLNNHSHNGARRGTQSGSALHQEPQRCELAHSCPVGLRASDPILVTNSVPPVSHVRSIHLVKRRARFGVPPPPAGHGTRTH